MFKTCGAVIFARPNAAVTNISIRVSWYCGSEIKSHRR